MDKILINELVIECLVGVLPHERIQKQTIILNLEIAVDIKKAAQSDDLKDTVDYAAVAARVRQFVEQSHYQLLEKLAEQIADLIINEFQVISLTLTLYKPGAIPAAKNAGLVIERRNLNYS